uniref:Uncharacterized protein n=1 Tax=Anopheles maculatus TaxID=74869 RepID=A0A182SJD7_9DIPT
MELSLYGSQINLATREKITTNQYRERPGSALQHPTRPCSAAGAHIRRPLSADSTQYRYRKRPSSSGSAVDVPRQIASPFHQRSTSSSSLLLKSLLAEPIPRYWETKSQPRSTQIVSTRGSSCSSAERIRQHKRHQTLLTDSSTRPVLKTKTRKRSESGCASKRSKQKANNDRRRRRDSTEEEDPDRDEAESTMDEMEDTQESNNEAELEGIWRGKPTAGNNREEKKRSPPLPMVALPLTRKAVEISSCGGLKKNNTSPEKQLRKIDLPGRVSFSSNEPYEIDYSDFEENEYGCSKEAQSKQVGKTKDPYNKKPAFSSSLYDERMFQEKSLMEEVSVKFGSVKFEEDLTTSSGYETKCDESAKATMRKRTSTVAGASPSPVSDVRESNKIIEEYKKEIEDLNRRHDMELRMAVRDVEEVSMPSKPYDPKCFTPSDTPEDLFANSVSTKAIESTTEDTDAELDRPACRTTSLLEKNVINEYYECINEIITEQSPSRRQQNRHTLPALDGCSDEKEDTIQHNLNNECTKSAPKDKQFASGVVPTGKSKSSNTDKNRLDASSNPVIKNYFKVKEQNIVSASASSLASGSGSSTTGSKSGHSKNSLASKKNAKEKPKSADTHKSILRNSKKQNNSVGTGGMGSNGSAGSGKFSSALCREDSNISEFHMDKV